HKKRRQNLSLITDCSCTTQRSCVGRRADEEQVAWSFQDLQVYRIVWIADSVRSSLQRGASVASVEGPTPASRDPEILLHVSRTGSRIVGSTKPAGERPFRGRGDLPIAS